MNTAPLKSLHQFTALLVVTAFLAVPQFTFAKEEHSKEAVSSEQALSLLKTGNTRFTSGKVRSEGQAKKDIERLSSGQKPHTIVLSCSDSRVPPELVFDQKLGEIFVVRTAGETLEPTSLGSIEYAVEHLGAKLILVMGHTSCGAVTAAYQTLEGKDLGSPNLNKLVQDIHPRISEFKGKAASAEFEKETWANAKGVAKDLMSRSKVISEAVQKGELKISTAVYYLKDGHVQFE
jgi:carbonic anhydrase